MRSAHVNAEVQKSLLGEADDSSNALLLKLVSQFAVLSYVRGLFLLPVLRGLKVCCYARLPQQTTRSGATGIKGRHPVRVDWHSVVLWCRTREPRRQQINAIRVSCHGIQQQQQQPDLEIRHFFLYRPLLHGNPSGPLVRVAVSIKALRQSACRNGANLSRAIDPSTCSTKKSGATTGKPRALYLSGLQGPAQLLVEAPLLLLTAPLHRHETKDKGRCKTPLSLRVDAGTVGFQRPEAGRSPLCWGGAAAGAGWTVGCFGGTAAAAGATG